MAISDGLGTKVFIGPVIASDDPSSSAYTSATYVEIGEVESVGEFGDSAASITFTSLSKARVRKRKGARDAGDVQVVCANDPLDAGQIAAKAAEKSKFRYAFKIEAADGPDANDTPSKFYFGALVTGARVNVGASNSVNKLALTLAIDTSINEVPAVVVP